MRKDTLLFVGMPVLESTVWERQNSTPVGQLPAPAQPLHYALSRSRLLEQQPLTPLDLEK